MSSPHSTEIVQLPANATEADWHALWAEGRGAHVVQGGESGLLDRARTMTRRRLEHGVRASLADYLGEKSTLAVHKLESSVALANFESLLNADERFVSLPSRLADVVRTVAEEIVGNAAHHAVKDPAPPIRIEWGWSAVRCGFSVVDHAGALTAAEVQPILARASGGEFREDPNRGAQMGLHLAASLANHLVIDIEAGSRTEIIAVFETGGAYRGYRRAGRAFDLYGAEAPARVE